VPLKLES
ncbi:hypothetical protein B4U80_06762, partial [Leptotrombidium deliense]